MPKLNLTETKFYKVDDIVEFDWIGQPHTGVIEKIHVNDKNMHVYFVRSTASNKLYNIGSIPHVTTTGYIKSKTGKIVKSAAKKVETNAEHQTITDELAHAIKTQKDFINHFFDI